MDIVIVVVQIVVTASKAAQAGRVAAAALRRLWIRHRVSPEFLTQKRQRGQLLPVLGLAHRPWQCQLDRQFVTALRIVGDQRGDVVEPVLASLQAQLPLVGLDQVMLDVRPLSRWQSNGQGHRVALTRLPDHEVPFLFALQQVESACSLDARKEPDRMGAYKPLDQGDVARDLAARIFRRARRSTRGGRPFRRKRLLALYMMQLRELMMLQRVRRRRARRADDLNGSVLLQIRFQEDIAPANTEKTGRSV